MCTVSSPLSVGGDNFQPQILKRGDQKKNESIEGLWLGLKSSCHKYLPGGLTMFLVKKDFVKYGFEGWLGYWVVICKGNQYPGLHNDV